MNKKKQICIDGEKTDLNHGTEPHTHRPREENTARLEVGHVMGMWSYWEKLLNGLIYFSKFSEEQTI